MDYIIFLNYFIIEVIINEMVYVFEKEFRVLLKRMNVYIKDLNN